MDTHQSDLIIDLSHENNQLVERFEQTKYWDIFEEILEDYERNNYLENIQEILEAGQSKVEERAKIAGKDIDQVKKKAAGDYFQRLVVYAILDEAQENGYRVLYDPQLDSHQELSSLDLDFEGESVKPDTDIVIYDPENDSPIHIFSCKTSLRERLTQSAMWKMFYSVSSHDCDDPTCPSHNYNQSGTDREVLVGFITIDWYDELVNNDVAQLLDVGYTNNEKSVDESAGIYPIDKLRDHIFNDWTQPRSE